MKWGGVVPFTLSDFPGCVAAVAFTRGCNFNCVYCHNRHLISVAADKSGLDAPPAPSTEDILAFLKRRRSQLDGFVISGGEPTCQEDLLDFIEAVKDLGLQVKLDTNGSHPDVLSSLLCNNLLDYVAMDIKAPWSKYRDVVRTSVCTQAIERGMNAVIAHGVSCEFRITTVSPHLTPSDVFAVAATVRGRAPLYLQQVQSLPETSGTFVAPFSDVFSLAADLNRQFSNIQIR